MIFLAPLKAVPVTGSSSRSPHFGGNYNLIGCDNNILDENNYRTKAPQGPVNSTDVFMAGNLHLSLQYEAALGSEQLGLPQ